MSEKKDNAVSSASARGLVVAGTVAALTAATGAAPEAIALAAAGSGALDVFIDRVVGFVRGQLDRDCRVWWQNVIANLGDDDVAEVLEERLEEPNVQRALFESLRALADRIDPTVVPSLGVLTAEYVREVKAPDWFLRGTARMLSDLSAEEFIALRILVEGVERAPATGLLELEFWRIDDPRQNAQCIVKEITFPSGGGIAFSGGAGYLDVPSEHVSRLMHALSGYGLGALRAENVRIEKSTIARLDRVLSPSTRR